MHGSFIDAHGRGDVPVCHDDGAVHLPEALRIELGQQLLQRRADQGLAAFMDDPGVACIGLEVDHLIGADQPHLLAQAGLNNVQCGWPAQAPGHPLRPLL